jgi:metal-dependent amidase/aminoacylase/carboxypeptidase family protein
MQALLHGLSFVINSLFDGTHAKNREGTNALDAAFLAYANISVLRQQLKPDHRVHGIVEGKTWAPNGLLLFEMLTLFPVINHIDYSSVIPDYAKMRYIARTPVNADLDDFVKRLKACFEYVMMIK